MTSILRRTPRGFSLLEVLVVMAIVLVLSAFAVPSMTSVIRRNQLESSARSVANALLRARSEAGRRNQLATAVYRESPAPPVYGIDLNGNFQFDADEPFLPLSSNVRITTSGAPLLTTMGATYDCAPGCPAQPGASPFLVAFSPRGTVMRRVTSGPQNYWIEASSVYVVFVKHVTSGEWAAVTITPSGRTRVWHWNGTAWSL